MLPLHQIVAQKVVKHFKAFLDFTEKGQVHHLTSCVMPCKQKKTRDLGSIGSVSQPNPKRGINQGWLRVKWQSLFFLLC